jgi:hypothetical protein
MHRSTTTTGVQAHSPVDQTKAVPNGANFGAATPGVRPHRRRRQMGPTLVVGCMAACTRRYGRYLVNILFDTANMWSVWYLPCGERQFALSPSLPPIRRGLHPLLQNTTQYTLELLLTSSCYLNPSLVVEQGCATRRACLLGRDLLGNNTMELSFIFKSLFSYRFTYELEYSYAHVMILIYELDYS